MWGFLVCVLSALIFSFADSADVIYLVISDGQPESFAARQSCRRTWLQFTKPRSHYFCLAGTPTAATFQEELEHEDLIQLTSVTDGYRSLSQKVLACFREVTLRAGTFDFIVKTDHDVFLRADILQSELSDTLARLPSANSSRNYWRGFVYNDMPPLRDLREKNADTELALMTLPPYTSGVAYILSAGLLQRILALPQHLFILNEDQAIGLWAAQLGGIQPVHDGRFQSFSVCSPSQLTFHPMTFNTSQQLMGNIKSGLPLCSGAEMDRWGSCCLCCNCAQQPFDLFSCSADGARFRGFYALSRFLRLPALSLSLYNSSYQIAELIFRQALDSRQFLLGTWRSTWPGLLAVQEISRTQQSLQLSCASQPAIDSRSDVCFAWLDTYSEQEQRVSMFSYGPQCAPLCKLSLNRSNDNPSSAQGWVLISASVNTHGACNKESLGTRQNLIIPDTGEQNFFLGRSGAFGAFCGFFVDAYHEDGTISTLQTPFSRNSPLYLHYDLLALSSGSPVSLVRLTLIIPFVPQVSVTVTDVLVTQFVSGRYKEFQPLLHEIPDMRPQSIHPCIKEVSCLAPSLSLSLFHIISLCTLPLLLAQLLRTRCCAARKNKSMPLGISKRG